MEFLAVLLILLLATRLFGEIAVRFDQPAMVGELLAGIALGLLVVELNGVFPDIGRYASLDIFRAVIDVAIFSLMLLAGIEMRPEEIAESSVSSFFVAIGGMAVPMTFGFALGWVFIPESDVKVTQAFFIGTALAITAVPVAIRMLMELGQLHTRIGQIIVSAAIFDDILGLAVLAALTAMIGTGDPLGMGGLMLLGAKVLLFISIVGVFGTFVYPRAGKWLKLLRASESELGPLLIAALAYAVLAEALGMHFILGPFAAGLFFGRQTIDPRTYDLVKSKVSGITAGFLAPIFFVSIGFRVDLGALHEIPVFTTLLVLAAFVSKFVGAGLPAYWRGLGRREAAAVGIGMSVRGAVELVVANVALQAGLFAQPDPAAPIIKHLFSAIVLMAVVTTVIAPIVLRLLLPRPP